MAAKKTPKKTTTRRTPSKSKRRTTKPTGPNLVIVESPAKARTIGRFLGADYEVRASMGHVRDLPVRGLGVEVDDDGFHPRYEVIPDKEKVVKELSSLAKKAPRVYFATDLDREGEAIAWHLGELLGVEDERRTRVTFHEITKRAIADAFEHPGAFDGHRVDAWQARRLLDRIVGYPLSRLLSKSVSRGLSAGRVQSVALRLISDREKEIRAFEARDYWRVFADLLPGGARAQEGAEPFATDLVAVDGLDLAALEDARAPEGTEDEIDQNEGSGNGNGDGEENGKKPAARPAKRSRELRLPTAEIAEELLAEFRAAPWAVESVEAKRKNESAPPPFITSTLQQQASIRLRWSAKRAMRVAQDLYEGLSLGLEGPTGLITYMRTDSVSLAPEAIADCRQLVKTHFGDGYVPAKPNRYRSRKGAQEAHEAIRPADVTLTPQKVQPHLSPDQHKLYRLIWERFVACQMAPAQIDTTVMRIRAGRGVFEARGRVVAFDGWRAVGAAKAGPDRAPELPALAEGDALDLQDLRSEQRTTQPPPRYTEATLVKRLEKEGIGRPSTYAEIISKIESRKYVTKEQGRFHCSELGEVVTDRMVPYFPDLMDPAFTGRMEGALDRVESGKEDWQKLLLRFHKGFLARLDAAQEEMPKHKFEPAEGVDPCEDCGKPMVVRFSKGEKFFGCSGYPECKSTRSPHRPDRPAPEPTEHVCEKCGKPMVIREGRRGRFAACTGYPECRNTKDVREDGTIVEIEPTGQTCEKCGADMVVKRGRRGPFLACSAYPKCRNARDVNAPAPAPGEENGGNGAAPGVELPECPECKAPMQVRRSRRGAFCGCTRYPECKGTAPAPKDALPKREPPKPAGKDCPSCGNPMLIRQGKRGAFAGCSGYPKCRETIPLDQLESN